MRQFDEERIVVIGGREFGLQVGEELFGQLQEVRRLRLVVLHEAANEAVPLLVTVDFPQYREELAQQGIEVVEEQPAVNRHASCFHVFGRSDRVRIADVGGKRVLLVLECRHVSHWQPARNLLRVAAT